MTKRVSNRKGKGGARSRRTWRAHYANVARSLANANRVIAGGASRPDRVYQPPRRVIRPTLISRVKRFFSFSNKGR